ncbi:Sugar fermentation stimulation protein A [compost metagenome]
MVEAVKAGYRGYLMFLIQMSGVRRFEPNTVMDPAFAQALRTASGSGVQVLAYDTVVTPDSMVLGKPVEVRL